MDGHPYICLATRQDAPPLCAEHELSETLAEDQHMYDSSQRTRVTIPRKLGMTGLPWWTFRTDTGSVPAREGELIE